jgi:PadR family transcriptional regulator PadR
MEMSIIIKRVKDLGPMALIKDSHFRLYVEKFESEVNRGISTLCILSIIHQSGSEGIYGYQILKELELKTDEMLVVEEGTLYPLLKKLERDGIIESRKQKTSGRLRTYYFLTENGYKTYNHMTGFYTKLTEAISPLFDVNVKLQDRYLYCPNCANKIDLKNEGPDFNFCEICGLNIQELKAERLKK